MPKCGLLAGWKRKDDMVKDNFKSSDYSRAQDLICLFLHTDSDFCCMPWWVFMLSFPWYPMLTQWGCLMLFICESAEVLLQWRDGPARSSVLCELLRTTASPRLQSAGTFPCLELDKPLRAEHSSPAHCQAHRQQWLQQVREMQIAD